MTQVIVLTLVPRSSAMSGRAADSTVIGNELDATPTSAMIWTVRGEYREAGRWSVAVTRSSVGERSFTSYGWVSSRAVCSRHRRASFRASISKGISR